MLVNTGISGAGYAVYGPGAKPLANAKTLSEPNSKSPTQSRSRIFVHILGTIHARLVQAILNASHGFNAQASDYAFLLEVCGARPSAPRGPWVC